MISFFLNVSFPRNRWQANCVFRSIATRKRNETLRLWPGSAEPCEAKGASLRTKVRAVKSCNLCPDSSLYPVLFYSCIPTAFYERSRMTGRYLIPFRKNHFFVSAHTYYLFFHVCSHLPLSTANAATFPDKRGQLTVCILSFMYSFNIRTLW